MLSGSLHRFNGPKKTAATEKKGFPQQLCLRSPHRRTRNSVTAELNNSYRNNNHVDHDVKEVMNRLEETSGLLASNPAFAQAFQGALQRQGVDALTRHQKRIDEKKPSPAEQVLTEGLRQARRNILKLENIKKIIENSIMEEEKQFERLQFALRRATSDAAYIRTLEKLRQEQKVKIQNMEDELYQ